MAINPINQTNNRQSGVTSPIAGSPTAPEKATAAPTGGTTKQFQGLAEALNDIQKKYVEEKKQDVADVYEIQFAEGMGECTIDKEGTTVYNKSSMPPAKTAGEKLDPKTNSLDTRGRTVPVTAGTQIIQLINQMVVSSSYISEQQKQYWDEKTQTLKPNDNASGPFKWFKVSLNAVPIKYDKKRNDFAYKMTYIVAPYEITQMQSQYFNDGIFQGLHKVYDYWFTGNNTQVLEFSQSFDNLYLLTISGTLPETRKQFSLEKTTTPETPVKKAVATASNQSTQQADGKTNEPAANAMEYLFTPADQVEVKIKIIGDPAWLQQGELTGLNLQNLTYDPFLPDGTINVDVRQVMFSINWNQISDYNLETGLMDINKGQYGRVTPQESAAYFAKSVTSTFSKGKFEQDIVGALITNLQPNALYNSFPTSDEIRQQAENNTGNVSAGSRTPLTGPVQSASETLSNKLPSTNQSLNIDRNPLDTRSAPPTPATSNGLIASVSDTVGNVINPIITRISGAINDPARTNQIIAKD